MHILSFVYCILMQILYFKLHILHLCLYIAFSKHVLYFMCIYCIAFCIHLLIINTLHLYIYCILYKYILNFAWIYCNFMPKKECNNSCYIQNNGTKDDIVIYRIINNDINLINNAMEGFSGTYTNWPGLTFLFYFVDNLADRSVNRSAKLKTRPLIDEQLNFLFSQFY